MTKLNQILAVVTGRKPIMQREVTKIHHLLAKSAMFGGLSKSYESKDDEGETYPGEDHRLQLRAEDMLNKAEAEWSRLWDLIATMNATNCVAKADVHVGDNLLLPAVPVTTLLFLEKQLLDVATLISGMPTLDPAHEWEFSKGQDCYATKPTRKTKTKKVAKPVVMYPATKEHPAQVKESFDDIVEGYWNTTLFSGAISEQRKNALLDRVQRLQEAIKKAREEANGCEVLDHKIGNTIFDYLLGDLQQGKGD